MADRGSAPCDGILGGSTATALIDSHGKLSKAQVGEKLRAEIKRERSSGVQYWALFDHRNGEFVGFGRGSICPAGPRSVPAPTASQVLYSRLHIGSAQRFPEARRLTAEDIEALATRITPSERLNRTFCRPVNLRARTASQWPLEALIGGLGTRRIERQRAFASGHLHVLRSPLGATLRPLDGSARSARLNSAPVHIGLPTVPVAACTQKA
jgi:hypothetical protein